jgi:phage gp29-like protein
MAGIYTNPTTYRKIGKPGFSLTEELATRKRVNFWGLSQWLPNPDPILREMGRSIAVYREVATDSHLRGCIKNRKGGVLSLKWGIDRGKAATRQSQAIIDIFDTLPIHAIIGEILEACQYGYTPLEIMWAPVDGLILPIKVIGKPPEWFHFGTNNELRLITNQSQIGEELPPNKFLLPRQEPTYDNPYGTADLSSCFWPATFKKGGVKFWVTFAEKYGMPFAIGKNPRGTDEEQSIALAEQLQAMVQDAVAVIPDDSTVELLEAAGKAASAEIYRDLVNYCKAEMSTVQLGHEGTALSTPGKLGNDNTAIKIRQNIIDADKGIVCEAMNTLIQWTWDMNFVGPRPTFTMWKKEDVDEKLARRDLTLSRSGVRFTKKYFAAKYGFEEGDFAIQTAQTKPSAPAGAEPMPAPDFTERKPID